jgi:histidine ammonia-lyase
VQSIELTGRSLTPEQVTLLACGSAVARIAPEALARAAAAAAVAERIAARQPVYGRTTGVGANRTQRVDDGDAGHGLRLLRSHAGGIGRRVSTAGTRAMLAVRANQLLAGGAGLRPEIIEAVVAALNADTLPEIHEFGGLGTADLTALAELGLALAGELPWRTGSGAPRSSTQTPLAREPFETCRAGEGLETPEPSHTSEPMLPAPALGPRPLRMTSGDALALMSSSALTIGQACLAWRDAGRWVNAAHSVSILTFLALDGSPEPYTQAVHRGKPHPGSVRSAAVLRALLIGQNRTGARIQDPYALRCIPQVHGAALSALESVERVLLIELNAAAENPLVSVEDEAFHHNGSFHLALLTQSLESLNLALLSVGQLSLARLNLTFHPEFTGLRPFLADGEPASSGVMILENSASDALSELRNAAMPTAIGHAALSRGVEDHTPFTSQATRQTRRAGTALRLVLATELVAAVRTLRLRAMAPASGTVLSDLYGLADVLNSDTADRSPSPDVQVAWDLLPAFADAAG